MGEKQMLLCEITVLDRPVELDAFEGEVLLTPVHLQALRAGSTLAISVDGEYTVYLSLENPDA
jgi:hypothetical protein